jgi:hypothetical protein
VKWHICVRDGIKSNIRHITFVLFIYCFFLTSFSDAANMAVTQTDRPVQKQNNTEGGFCTLIADRHPKQRYFEGSQASPACPFDKTSIKTKMSVVHWCNDTDRGKRKRQEKTPVTVSLCLSEVSEGLTRGSNPSIRCQIIS